MIDPNILDNLQADVIETMCRFEMYFPPSFFDIMPHLIIHLVREIKLCGPVCMRYMWPFERHMGTLKGKVMNPARQEASIVQRTRGVRGLGWCGLGCNPTQTANIRFENFPTQTAPQFSPNQPKPNRAKRFGAVWVAV